MRSIGRTFSSLSLGLSLLIAAMSAATRDAQAELSDAERAATKLSEAEVGPRGQHMPREIKYSAWRKVCFTTSDAKTLCRTTSEGTWDTGQVAVCRPD